MREPDAEMAKTFAEHVLTDMGPSWWRCGTPDGSGIFAFEIFVAPYMVVLWGDLGEIVLRHSAKESLHWVVTCPSMDYVLGKATATRGPKEEFSLAAALRVLDDRDDDIADNDYHARNQRIREALEGVEYEGWEDQQRAWYEAWGDEGVSSSDVAECMVWPRQLEWQWACLQTFARLWWARDERYEAECAAVCAL